MATSSSLFFEEQFLCAICLEVFSEPVSISCGHNFCKACITEHWKGKHCRECPLCKKKFSKGYKVWVNTGFRDVVENFKKHQVFTSNESSNWVEPSDVPCDCCLNIKHKGTKTCWTCLAFCSETQPEPHHGVPSLKRHKLTEPVKNLDDKICKKHDRILEHYCRNDQILFCVMCTEHATHSTAPIEEVYEEMKAELETEKKKMQEMIQETQNKVQEMKAEVQTKKKVRDKRITNSSEVFSTLVRSIERRRDELVEKINENQQLVERLSEISVKTLEENVTELQTRSKKLEELSPTEDHLQFIQSFVSFSSSSPTDKGSSDTSAKNHRCVEDVRRNLAELDTLTDEVEQIDKEVRACWRKTQKDETDQIKILMEIISTIFRNIRLIIRQHPNGEELEKSLIILGSLMIFVLIKGLFGSS